MNWSSPGYRSSKSLMFSITLSGGPHSHALWATPSRIVGCRAGCTPGPALRVRIAGEAERREPLKALVVEGIDKGNSCLLTVGEKETDTPVEVISEHELAITHLEAALLRAPTDYEIAE